MLIAHSVIDYRLYYDCKDLLFCFKWRVLYLCIFWSQGSVLCLGKNVEAIVEHVLHTAPEVLLVAKKDLVEVSHTAEEHAVVDVEFKEPAR